MSARDRFHRRRGKRLLTPPATAAGGESAGVSVPGRTLASAMSTISVKRLEVGLSPSNAHDEDEHVLNAISLDTLAAWDG